MVEIVKCKNLSVKNGNFYVILLALFTIKLPKIT